METYLNRYDAVAAPFTAVVEQVPDWQAATPCEGWTATDLVEHVITTQRDYLGQHVELPDLALVEPQQRWLAHDRFVRGVLEDESLAHKQFEGYFGPTTLGEQLVDFYGWDLLVHRWDLAKAAGVDADLTTEELDRIDPQAEAFGDQLYAEGICAPALDVPDDADQVTRVLARLGRDAGWQAGR